MPRECWLEWEAGFGAPGGRTHDGVRVDEVDAEVDVLVAFILADDFTFL